MFVTHGSPGKPSLGLQDQFNALPSVLQGVIHHLCRRWHGCFDDSFFVYRAAKT